MATLAFLLNPDRDIPALTDPEWFGPFSGFNAGTWMTWRSFRSTLPEGDRPRQAWFDTQGLTTNAADYMVFNRAEHKELFKAYIAERHQRWLAAGKPDIVEGNGPAEFEAWTGKASKLGLGTLSGYRGLDWGKATRGKHGLVHQAGKPHAFELSAIADVEPAMLAEFARAYGGESLGMWTYGRSLQLVLHRNGQRHVFRIRTKRASDKERAPALLARLRAAFEGAGIEPDWKVIEQQLKAPEISLVAWYQAFGLPGAMELTPAEGPALWQALERAGSALLGGAAPAAADAKALNKHLPTRLPAKPGKGMARKVAGAIHELAEILGWQSAPDTWKARREAAARYWTIVDGAGLDRLTTGTDKKGIGTAASLGRLLPYYPPKLFRDPLFLAMAALEAEAANGHAFVAALEGLAENAADAGMTSVLVPDTLAEKFRKDFGIDGGKIDSADGMTMEVFVDHGPMLKADVAEVARAWLARQKIESGVIRIAADGKAEALPGGVKQPPVEAAGKALDPHALAAALGFPTLLAPVQDAPSTSPASGFNRAAVLEALKQSATAAPVDDWHLAAQTLPEPQKPTALRLTLSTADEGYAEQLLEDLAGKFRVRWREGKTVFAGSPDERNWEFVAQLIGDPPAGSELVVAAGKGALKITC